MPPLPGSVSETVIGPDVAIKGDRVVLVSRSAIPAARAARVVDATGKIVAPGFIDMHAHIDPLMQLLGAESAARRRTSCNA